MLRRTLLAAVVLTVALPATVTHAAGKPGTFSGSLGITVPKGGHGEVRAVDRASRAVGAARPVGRTGRFSLSLPAGAYLVIGTVVTPKGKVLQKRIGVSLKPGQKRKSAKLTARKRRRKAKRSAHAAFVQERGNITPGRVAVEIPDVTGTIGDPEWDAVRRGINDLVTTDVVNGGQDCGLAVLEVDRRADVIKELEFQQSPYVDPSTRVTRNFILGDVEVRGAIVPAGNGGVKLTMTIVDKHTGKQLGSRSTTLAGDWFNELERFDQQLTDDLCKLSDVYEVTLDVQGDGRFATHSGSGTIHTVLQARRNDPGKQVWRATGPLQWGNVSFASKIGDCSMIDYVIPVISWSVTIVVSGDDQLQVTWTRDGNDATTASIDCRPTSKDEPDPPPVPGQPGSALLNTGPESFFVPFGGGTQPLSGVVADGGDGFFNAGSLTVKPGGIG